MVGLTQLAGDEIAPEVFVNRCEQEIMIDADRDAAVRGLLDERGTLLGIGSHGLFQEDVQPRVDQGRCGSSMQVRREKHVDDVKLGLPVPEHLFQRFVTTCRPVAFAECPGPGQILVAHRHQRRAGDRTQRLGVPVGDVSGTQETDAERLDGLLHRRDSRIIGKRKGLSSIHITHPPPRLSGGTKPRYSMS